MIKNWLPYYRIWLLIFFLLLSCSNKQIWNIPVEEIRLQCRIASYSFLENVNFEKQQPDEIRKLSPGAAFYFFHIFQNLGREKEALQVLKTGYNQGEIFWKQQCGARLIQYFLEKEQYEAAEQVAADFIEEHRNFPHIQVIKKQYIEALYWQKKDSATLQFLEKYFSEDKMDQPELMLFQAVALYRQGISQWQDVLIQLFLKVRSSLLHSRLYRFLEIQDALHHFSGAEQALLQAKYLFNTGRLEEAVPLLKQVLNNLDPDLLTGSTLVRELASACLGSGRYAAGAAFLAGIADKFQGNERLTAIELAGQLYRKLYSYNRSRQLLKIVFTGTDNPHQEDRALWYYLDTLLSQSPRLFLDEFPSWIKKWNEPAYFADLLDDEITYLVSDRKWKELWQFYKTVEPLGLSDLNSRLCYILARIISSGLFTVPGEDNQKLVSGLLDPVHYSQGINYYSFLAAWSSGRLPGLFTAKPEDMQPSRDELLELDILIEGYFEFGLTEEALVLVDENKSTLARGTIVRAARDYIFRGEFKQGISLMMQFDFDDPLSFSKQELEYLYPLAYQTLIEPAAEKEKLDKAVFYGLIYKESAFDPTVTSWAGATGLCQLMPETAMDMARLINIQEPDLTDPATNLGLGARYFSKLINLFSSVARGLMAYNAGLSRVRSWDKMYTGLPLDLYVEALPFEETRTFYIRIITAAVMYGYLYYDRVFSKTLEIFYPGLPGR